MENQSNTVSSINIHPVYKSRPPNVPKLDLTKAKKIQDLNARKNFHQVDSGNKENEVKYIEKLKQFDNELMKCRQSLQNEMLHNKLLMEQNEDLKLQKKNIQIKLENIQKSDEIQREKIQKYFSYMKFCKQIYSKYMNLLSIVTKNNLEFKESINSMSNKNQNKYSSNRPYFETSNEIDLEKKSKSNLKKSQEKVANFKTFNELEELICHDINFSMNNKKQKYIEYLKSLANEFSNFLEKNQSIFLQTTKKEPKIKRNGFELYSFQRIAHKKKFHKNNSNILDYQSNGMENLFAMCEIYQELEQNFSMFGKKELNLSHISQNTNENFNLSSFDDNWNDVSQTGEILVMNKFQNPFQINFKPNKKDGPSNINLKIQNKLYSPLGKINPDLGEVSFEKSDGGKKVNLSFISNNDEIFF